MAERGFGAASDYYRVRLKLLDDTDSPDLDWHDDVLYRTRPAVPIVDQAVWRVEAVDLDDDENVVVLGAFKDQADAHEALTSAEEDLRDMTRIQFEDRYFPADL
jgi:hypothetical protein